MTMIVHPGFALRVDRDVLYLRRYARALTGSQIKGDMLTQHVLGKFDLQNPIPDVKVALFTALYGHLAQTTAPTTLPGNADNDLSHEALLLRCLEGFEVSQIAEILDITEAEAETLLTKAFQNLKAMRRCRIMLIEDEFLIAMQMSNAISEFGHSIVGIARTRAEAVATAIEIQPDLILSDIALADDSSGIEAIDEISTNTPHLAVIYLTGYPERLLTGSHREPAFVLVKPYKEEQVLSAISQALKIRDTALLAANGRAS